MKKVYLSGLVCLLFINAQSQINQGGFHANFGIDADTRASYYKYGSAANTASGDDWFFRAGYAGKGVIDTANTAWYKNQLQSNKNMSFVQRMSENMYSANNGKLWLDAVYTRDFVSSPGRDSTTFSSGHNGENPNQWDGANRDLETRFDIVDAYAHFRRDGISAQDSLWFFGAVTTIANASGRYVDFELYKKPITYNRNNRTFNTSGTASGHTPWVFDLFGNVIQTGDVLITIIYQSGQKPLLDVHIWTSRLTTYLINPAKFKFGTGFHGANSYSSYGYVNILPKQNNIRWGGGIQNSSSSTSTDTTFSTPWGTIKANGSYSANYDRRQLVEIGLNFSRIGIDPSDYAGTVANNCDKLYESILFKSGHYEGDGDDDGQHSGYYIEEDVENGYTEDMVSNSGNGCGDDNSYVDLEDFAGPVSFSTPPSVTNFTVSGGTLTCANPIVTLSINNVNGDNKYTWNTSNGHIIGSNADSTVIQVKKQGNYSVTASLVAGCSETSTENIAVAVDSVAPIAIADIGMTPEGEIQLIGGDPLLTTLLTPLGCSSELEWSWTGPNDFTSNQRSPIINLDWAWGAYYLTVTETRNGCKSNASLDVSFRTRANVTEENTTMHNGKTYVHVNNSNKLNLVTSQPENAVGSIAVFNSNGQVISMQKNVQFVKGQNSFVLPVTKSNQVRIVSVYIGNKLMFSRKVMF